MKKHFGTLPSGQDAYLYTIKNDKIIACISDFGATLVNLWIPDKSGHYADVVLGHDCAGDYWGDTSCMGATVGRNANRIAGASLAIGDKVYKLPANDGKNSLHSLPDGYNQRIWTVSEHSEDQIQFTLFSPHLDQGFPGNAFLYVTYAIESPATLTITYEATCDADTIFNLTNHSFFNLAGHEKLDCALNQHLIIKSPIFIPSDATSIPLGEERAVDGTPMDFRQGKRIGDDIDADDNCLKLQGGFDHTFCAEADPCAILSDPISGRTMSIRTDCPGVHFYSGNYLHGEPGKGGIQYPRRSGICLETHFYPDAVHNPQWKQPFIPAGKRYRSKTSFIF